MNRCRSCSAPILWARTTKGKRIPLDAEPNPAGNVTLLRGIATVHSGTALALAAQTSAVYMPHHATCPSANDWRNR